MEVSLRTRLRARSQKCRRLELQGAVRRLEERAQGKMARCFGRCVLNCPVQDVKADLLELKAIGEAKSRYTRIWREEAHQYPGVL